MTRYNFMKKNALKYAAAIATSMYAISLVSPNLVTANEKNIDNISQIESADELKDVTDLLGEELESSAKTYSDEINEQIKNAEERFIENTLTINNGELEIVLDTEFPNVVEYRMGDKIIKGTDKSKDLFLINGELYKPTIKEKSKKEEKGLFVGYLYTLAFEEIDVEMKISLSIMDNAVTLNFESIEENGDFLVYDIEIPSHNLVTINENEESPDIAAAKVFYVLSSDDYFYSLADKELDEKPVNQTMVMMENGQLAASIENNTLDYERQMYYQTTMDGDTKKAGMWNATWTYREVESEIVELPWSKIVISDDANGSGDVDWQDAAIAHREHMKKPHGYDVVKDNVSHVAMNFASQAQYPFDRLTDQVAKYSNYLDGFGQMLLIKGYQSEGHDSGHPDYGNNFNERAGGVEEFNEMAKKVGEDYNTLVGVHINTTEIYPEAKHFNFEMLEKPYREGWNWLDQSWYVDKRKDILDNGPSGLKARLDELKDASSELDWVYVDVYREKKQWHEYKLQEFLMDNDWYVATEWSGPMRRNAIWTHWADLTYNEGKIENGVDLGEQYRGTRSQIVRFVENEMKDVFPNDILLKGNKNKGFMGWSGDCPIENNIDYSVETFYNWTLPTKYMQHFPIIEWNKNESVKFEGDLEVKVVEDTLDVNEYGKVLGGDTEMYKDGNLIYSGTTYRNDDRIEDKNDKLLSKNDRVFIPYSETDIENPEKIYAWNDFEEERTWHLPKSWKESGVEKVYLYETNDQGRTFIEEINVVNGQVTLNLNGETPYVIYSEKVEDTIGDTEWGSTSNVGDHGFDSKDFIENEEDTSGYWRVASTSGKTDHIGFYQEEVRSAGQTYAMVDGKHDAKLSQEITLEGGKDYSASVWAEITPGKEREVALEIELANGDKFEKSIDATNSVNYTKNSDKMYTNFNKIKVDFTLPTELSSATVNLKVAKGDGDAKVYFDNVRVLEHERSEEEITGQNEHYYYEDFESVDEHWGPFVQPLNGPTRTHLSELHEGYTNDTINGNWSLKSQEHIRGLVLRTTPGILEFKPNKEYTVKFDYKFPVNSFDSPDAYGKYDLVLKTDKGGNEEGFRVTLPEYEGEYGTFEYTFETGKYNDHYLAFDKLSDAILVIDNFTIDEHETTDIVVNPVNNFGITNIDKTSIDVTWNEPNTTSGLVGYVLYKDGKKVSEVPAHIESYTFKGLKRHTIYNLKVAAKYENGEISSKESITIRTKR
ncbi:endo-alpha-N-acetylgalactosaminidase family protein [Clostridium sp. B9]|uniref:endo-alpha-N-acetylgalactosaminidase family protein n=1 Tax=Clostridium sp. B9 TaxID=3423224 RepID=UPI003D2F1A1C